MTEGALSQGDNRGKRKDGLLGCYDCPRDHKICEKSQGTTRSRTGPEGSRKNIARGGPDNIRDRHPSLRAVDIRMISFHRSISHVG